MAPEPSQSSNEEFLPQSYLFCCWQDLVPHRLLDSTLAPHCLFAGGCSQFLATWASSGGSSQHGNFFHQNKQTRTTEKERECKQHRNHIFNNFTTEIISHHFAMFCSLKAIHSVLLTREGEYYVRMWIPRGRDHWQVFRNCLPWKVWNSF